MNVASARRRAGSLLRNHVMREGSVWRIPVGLGQGLRVVVQEGETANLQLYLGTFEAEIAPHFRRLVHPGTRCVDIGGNNAYYAMICARLSGVEAVSIDAAEDALALAERNLRENPELAPLVRLERAFVANTLAPGEGFTTIDELVERGTIPPPGLIKVDVEGSELAVLEGARETLRSHRPNLIVETHSRPLEQAIGDLLTGSGYRVRIVTQRRWFSEGRPLGDNRWLVAEPV